MSAPSFMPIIEAAPAKTTPMKGIEERPEPTEAPTLPPTILPVPSPPPRALMHSIVLALIFFSPSPVNPDGSIHEVLVETGPTQTIRIEQAPIKISTDEKPYTL